MAMVMAEIEELRKISGVFGDTVVGKGGIYVDINPVSTEPSSTPTPNTRILLRADCDGLPVPEATGLPFTSTNGNSHACGHDMHMAMLLTAMRVFCARSPTFPLRCVFQRAEENPITKSGGAVMCSEDNVLQNIMEVYGLHVWATLPANKFYSRPAEILANSDRLRVSISCCGGHASNPSTTTNPIQVSANIISRLDGFDERTLPPQTVSALVPTILHSGTASNVIPNTAELWFGVRNFLPPSARSSFHEQLCQEVSNAASHFPLADLTVTPKIIPGHPATINSPTCVASLAANLRTHLAPGDVSTTTPPILGGEDFSHYLQARPGAFFLLGAHTPTSGDHHSPAFNPDERVLWRGVLYWCAIAYGAESESGESPDTTFLGSTRYACERSEWRQVETRDARREPLFPRSSFICSKRAESGPKRTTGGSKRAASGVFWSNPLAHEPYSPPINPRSPLARPFVLTAPPLVHTCVWPSLTLASLAGR